MIHAIVFDFDGVLVDSEPLHYRAFLEVARELGVEFDYDYYLQHLVGFDDRDAFEFLLRQADNQTAAPALPELCDRKQQAFEQLAATSIEPIPGALELAEQAAAEMPVAVASGATRRDIELILSALGRLELFPVIVTADDVERSKPDPQTYAKAVAQLAERFPDHHITPARSLAIEDTPTGLQSAQAAGLQCLALTTTTDPTQLNHPGRVVDNLSGVKLAQLHEWFR